MVGSTVTTCSFLLGWPIFRGELLVLIVLGRVIRFKSFRMHLQPHLRVSGTFTACLGPVPETSTGSVHETYVTPARGFFQIHLDAPRIFLFNQN